LKDFLHWYVETIKETLERVYHWKGWALFELYGIGTIGTTLCLIGIPLLVVEGELPQSMLWWMAISPITITIGFHGYYRLLYH
jgi:hypothetical protein